MQETNVLSRPSQGTATMNAPLSEELTIHIPNTYSHTSAMPESLKQEAQKHAPSLVELFAQTLQEKGAYDSANTEWLSENEVEVKELPNLVLHSFILKAEELGKKITYTKTLTVKISD